MALIEPRHGAEHLADQRRRRRVLDEGACLPRAPRRAVTIVESGESAREAARLLNIGASTAIRWIERWTTTGSVEANPGTGHGT
jgi:transposase-like protein